MPQIPLVDVREGGPVALARLRHADALALRDACFSAIPGMARAAAPLADGWARRWLERSDTPFRAEIEAISRMVGPGVYAINTSFEWGCTTRSADGADGLPMLRRTLDWPFHGLGRHVNVARQEGPAGEYLNVTWPGAVGVLTAVAPGRFCAAINQAPLRTRSAIRALHPVDIAAQAFRTWRDVRAMPSSHLLRLVFDSAPDYETALLMLREVPIARPTLFTLAGILPGQTCLVERSMTETRVHRGAVTVANDWQEGIPGWHPRGGGPTAPADNRARRDHLAAADAVGGFGWVAEPVLCRRTRLAVAMSAAGGELGVLGYEVPKGGVMPVPATEPFSASERLAA